MNIFKQQAEFMRACDQTVGEYNEAQAIMYSTLIMEEFEELIQAETAAEGIKELMDLIVVLVGYGHSAGWDIENAWQEVWESNMSKIDPVSGKVLKREDGKVLKGENYKLADVAKYV